MSISSGCSIWKKGRISWVCWVCWVCWVSWVCWVRFVGFVGFVEFFGLLGFFIRRWMFSFHKRIQGLEGPRGQVKPTSASEIFYPVKSRSEHHHLTWDLKVLACPYWAKPTTQSALSVFSAALREACCYFKSFEVRCSTFVFSQLPIAHSLWPFFYSDSWFFSPTKRI